jgi:hypothetical protein
MRIEDTNSAVDSSSFLGRSKMVTRFLEIHQCVSLQGVAEFFRQIGMEKRRLRLVAGVAGRKIPPLLVRESPLSTERSKNDIHPADRIVMLGKEMKKIALLALLIVCGFVVWMLVAPRIRLDHAARSHDPGKMKLNHVKLMHKSTGILPNSIETGFVHLDDGSKVKFWFINKHVQPGKGLTRFDFQDGETVYLSGAYCCEIWVGDEAVKNKNSLLSHIRDVDGSMP